MDLTTLKHWQWGVIGVALGAIVGFSWMNMPGENPRSGSAEDFKAYVGQLNPGRNAPALKDQPIITNIVVLPPEPDPDGKQVYTVTYDRLGVSSAGKPVYRADTIYAKSPFEANQSVVEFLQARNVSFSDRTGIGKYRPVALGATLGLFTVGFLWPTVISFLVGAGLEKPRPRAEKKVYATGEIDDGTIKEKKKGVNAKDLNDLNALNDRLEASVGKGLKSRGAQADAKEVDEIVSKLMSGSGSRNTQDPTAATAPAQTQEEKEYAGEWYPVARPKHQDTK